MKPLQTTPLIQSITNLLISIQSDKPFVIGIDGLYGAGKTSFANALGQSIQNRPNSCLILSTDDFMCYSRTERQQSQARYLNHSGWYDLAKLSTVLEAIRTNRNLIFHLDHIYNHTTGELDRTLDLSLQETNFIILEGMYALDETIWNHIEFSILLVAEHDVLLRRVIHRDAIERGLQETFVRERYSVINGVVYQKYLDSCTKRAHLVLDVSSEYEFSPIYYRGLGEHAISIGDHFISN